MKGLFSMGIFTNVSPVGLAIIILAIVLVVFVIAYVLILFNPFKIPIQIKARLEKIFGMIGKTVLIIVLSLFFILPLWIVIAASFTDSIEFIKSGYSVYIPKFSLDAYAYVFKNEKILKGLLNSVLVTAIVTVLSSIVNTLAAYALSIKEMPGNKLLNGIFVFTMLFAAGMVPTVLVIRMLGIYDTFWALIIPPVINVYNILLMRNYMTTIPKSLKEACVIDGGGHIRVFFEVVLPMSVPIIATTTMMSFVLKWNSYMDILYYVAPSHTELWTIQYVIMDLLSNMGAMGEDETIISKYVVQSATIVTTMLPLICIFPFLQRYFTKGLTSGAVKG